jgi:hypothetical protein
VEKLVPKAYENGDVVENRRTFLRDFYVFAVPEKREPVQNALKLYRNHLDKKESTISRKLIVVLHHARRRRRRRD